MKRLLRRGAHARVQERGDLGDPLSRQIELRHVLLGSPDREKLAEPGAAFVLEHDRGLQQIGAALRAAARIGAVTEGALLPEDLLPARGERGRRRLARSRRRGFGRRLRGGVARGAALRAIDRDRHRDHGERGAVDVP